MTEECPFCEREIVRPDPNIDPAYRLPCPVCGTNLGSYPLSTDSGKQSSISDEITGIDDGFIGREKALQDLHTFIRSGMRVAVLGDTGAGKTALLTQLIQVRGYNDWHWASAADSSSLRALNDSLRNLRPVPDPYRLMVLDDCEYLANDELYRLLLQIINSNAFYSIILLTPKEFGIPSNLRVRYYPVRPWQEYSASRNSFLYLLEPSKAIEIESVSSRVILLNEGLVQKLQKYPNDIYHLPSRKFEELIADLLTDQGCEVELTQQTRDGGKDIIASVATPIGRVLNPG